VGGSIRIEDAQRHLRATPREAAMNAKQQVKELVKDAFPSIWLQWHFMKRPKSAERELSYLDKLIPDDAVTVDVGANCGLYTRRLARLSRQVHAFEPSQQMAGCCAEPRRGM